MNSNEAVTLVAQLLLLASCSWITFTLKSLLSFAMSSSFFLTASIFPLISNRRAIGFEFEKKVRTSFMILFPLLALCREALVLNSINNSSIYLTASSSLWIKSFTRWLQLCCSSASLSTDWILETVFRSFSSSFLTSRIFPISCKIWDPNFQ